MLEKFTPKKFRNKSRAESFTPSGRWFAYLVEKLNGFKIPNNTETASEANQGAVRYKNDGTSSTVEIVMQTGAETFEWVEIAYRDWA